ncbi:PREDICTED: cytochrome P450 4C1-like [Vollenhovia emeryi]|uniref:cytochrome P450 4C1-like n=1 Tax=Vollenhovia emeryi TaxID=411798 RepID=UPI0005F47146|nr:PREDICTED: cytochrome P450 4C1-like [Vollenhovia emeryi]
MLPYFGLVRRKRLAMLDLLIAASRNGLMTDADIREEVDTFMFEGHDTTAMALCFILALLAEHKDIQVSIIPINKFNIYLTKM